ncbi:hypothetical protein [Luteibacter sp. RCC_6_2]|uniref:hypothetical protein n=1 Tax=Luteibacter sp. RCC_6_2 TaxID=3239223 RepID=UPI0035256480
MNEFEERRNKIKGWIQTYSLNPEPYVLLGTAHPERALLNIPEFSFRGADSLSEAPIVMLASVINGRIVVHLYTDAPRDLEHLKQYAWGAIDGQVAIASFLCGYAFTIEITQAFHVGQGINYVYAAPGDGRGIELSAGRPDIFGHIRNMATGRLGAFITRCLSDLSMALQHPSDAAFYCYRAIESLNQHSIENSGMAGKSEGRQWEEFRRQAGCTKDDLMKIKDDADPVRHGNHLKAGAMTRETVMDMTRKVVTTYLGIASDQSPAHEAGTDVSTI